MLTKKDQKKISKELSPLSGKWREIGITLAVPVSTLDKVDKSHRTVEQKLSGVVKEWLTMAGGGASWQTVVEALRSSTLREHRLARDLEGKYCSSGSGPPSSGSSISTSTGSSESSGQQKTEEGSENGRSQTDKVVYVFVVH